MKIYYDKDLIKKESRLYCYGINLTEEEKKELKENYVVYTSDSFFSGYPIIEGEHLLRQATLVELVDMGKYKLADGEVLNRETGLIEKIERPSYQYIWDNNKWIADKDSLYDGQYIENNKIITVEYNKELGYQKPIWDKEQKKWIDGITKLELINIRKDKILEYKKVKEEVTVLEEFSDEFTSDETIEILKNQMVILKKEINDLYEKIKSM